MLWKKSAFIVAAIVCFIVLIVSLYSDNGDEATVDPLGGKAAEELTDSNHEAGADTLRLKVAVSVSERELDVLEQMSGRYEAAHPGIKVMIDNIAPQEAYAKMKKTSQLGAAPDVMLLDNISVNEFAALGFLHPVDEYFTTEQQALQLGQMMSQVKWNGYTWAIPKDVDPYLLAYHKPTFGDIWEQTKAGGAEALAALQAERFRQEEKKYGIYFDGTDAHALIALIRSFGQARLKQWEEMVFSEGGADNKNNSRNGSGWLKVLVPPVSAEWRPWEQLRQGNIAVLLTTLSEYKFYENEEVALSGFPDESGQWSTSLLRGNSYAISSRSELAAQAADWIREMTTAEASVQSWIASGKLPALLPAYQLDPIYRDARLGQWLPFVENGKVLPSEPETSRRVSALQADTGKLWTGELTIEQYVEAIGKWLPN